MIGNLCLKLGAVLVSYCTMSTLVTARVGKLKLRYVITDSHMLMFVWIPRGDYAATHEVQARRSLKSYLYFRSMCAILKAHSHMTMLNSASNSAPPPSRPALRMGDGLALFGALRVAVGLASFGELRIGAVVSLRLDGVLSVRASKIVDGVLIDLLGDEGAVVLSETTSPPKCASLNVVPRFRTFPGVGASALLYQCQTKSTGVHRRKHPATMLMIMANICSGIPASPRRDWSSSSVAAEAG